MSMQKIIFHTFCFLIFSASLVWGSETIPKRTPNFDPFKKVKFLTLESNKKETKAYPHFTVFPKALINGKNNVIFMHPYGSKSNSLLISNILVGKNSKLIFDIGQWGFLPPSSYTPVFYPPKNLNPLNASDGVQFSVNVVFTNANKNIAPNKVENIFTYIPSKKNTWLHFEVDLKKYEGQTIGLNIETLGILNNQEDWAYWGDIGLKSGNIKNMLVTPLPPPIQTLKILKKKEPTYSWNNIIVIITIIILVLVFFLLVKRKLKQKKKITDKLISKQLIPEENAGILFFQKRKYVYSLIFTILFLAYIPTLHGYYVHHDDYLYFISKHVKGQTRTDCTQHPIHGFVVREAARPGAGLYICAVDSTIQTIDQANIVRFAILIFLTALACLTHRFLTINSYSSFESFLLAVFIFSLPPYQAHIGYLANGYQPIAALMAGFGGFLTYILSTSSQLLNKWRTYLYKFLILFLLLCSLFTYQQGMMFYWFFIAIILIKIKPSNWKKWERKILFLFFLPGMAMLMHFLYIIFMPRQTKLASLATDPMERWNFFIDYPLFESLNLWNLFATQQFARIVGAIIIIGIIIEFTRSLMNPPENISRIACFFDLIKKHALIFLLLPISMLPLLASTGSSSPRVQLALTPIITLLAYWAIKQILKILFPKSWGWENIKRQVSTSIFTLATFVGVYYCNYNLSEYFNLNDTLVLRFIKSNIKRTGLENLKTYDRIHIINTEVPLASYVSPKGARVDSFGMPSTSASQDIPAIIEVALAETGLNLVKYIDSHNQEVIFFINYPGFGVKPIIISYSIKSELKDYPGKILIIDTTQLDYFW